jgi:hypothetical protein
MNEFVGITHYSEAVQRPTAIPRFGDTTKSILKRCAVSRGLADEASACLALEPSNRHSNTYSHTLIVEHRPEDTCNFHHFLLSPQHSADVFVCGWSFVTNSVRFAGVVPHSIHLPTERPPGDLRSSTPGAEDDHVVRARIAHGIQHIISIIPIKPAPGLPPSFRTAIEPEEASTCGGCRLR